MSCAAAPQWNEEISIAQLAQADHAAGCEDCNACKDPERCEAAGACIDDALLCPVGIGFKREVRRLVEAHKPAAGPAGAGEASST